MSQIPAGRGDPGTNDLGTMWKGLVLETLSTTWKKISAIAAWIKAKSSIKLEEKTVKIWRAALLVTGVTNFVIVYREALCNSWPHNFDEKYIIVYSCIRIGAISFFFGARYFCCSEKEWGKFWEDLRGKPEDKEIASLFSPASDHKGWLDKRLSTYALLFTLGLVLALSIQIVKLDYKNRFVLVMPIDISPWHVSANGKDDTTGGGGGGGDRDKLAASKGALPKLSKEQFTPPSVVIRNPDPKLAVEPTVVVPPDIKLPQTGPLGDPMAQLGPPSNGTGFGGGIGSGSGGGVGSGRGPGVGPGWGGGIGGGVYRVGGGVTAPRIIYQPDPEYSDEARKAKYEGTVVLYVEVAPDGRTHNIRVQRSLGLGLDEKAIEAVRTWKFEPARKNGQAVTVGINIEVTFRLY